MQKHEKIKKTLKIVGPIILAIGIIVSCIGIFPFVFSFNTATFGLSFVGFPLIMVGAVLTSIGFSREMQRYNIDEHKENRKYMANYMMDGTRDAFVKTTEAIKNGEIKKIFCPYCGSENDSDASFCKECGKSLKNICPYCGSENDKDAKFCDNCGQKLKD